MTPAARAQAERDFARAMLAEPTAEVRLVYADWLEDEAGDVARAALVREAEGWSIRLESVLSAGYGCVGVMEVASSGLPTGNPSDLRFAIEIVDARYDTARRGWIRISSSMGSLLCYLDEIERRCVGVAWLLSLALSRGLVIPGLSVPSKAPFPAPFPYFGGKSRSMEIPGLDMTSDPELES